MTAIDRETVADFTGFCDCFAVGYPVQPRIPVVALR